MKHLLGITAAWFIVGFLVPTIATAEPPAKQMHKHIVMEPLPIAMVFGDVGVSVKKRAPMARPPMVSEVAYLPPVKARVR